MRNNHNLKDNLDKLAIEKKMSNYERKSCRVNVYMQFTSNDTHIAQENK